LTASNYQMQFKCLKYSTSEILKLFLTVCRKLLRFQFQGLIGYTYLERSGDVEYGRGRASKESKSAQESTDARNVRKNSARQTPWRAQTGISNHVCSSCNYGAAASSNLDIHTYKIIREKNCKCSYCGRCFIGEKMSTYIY